MYVYIYMEYVRVPSKIIFCLLQVILMDTSPFGGHLVFKVHRPRSSDLVRPMYIVRSYKQPLGPRIPCSVEARSLKPFSSGLSRTFCNTLGPWLWPGTTETALGCWKFRWARFCRRAAGVAGSMDPNFRALETKVLESRKR